MSLTKWYKWQMQAMIVIVQSLKRNWLKSDMIEAVCSHVYTGHIAHGWLSHYCKRDAGTSSRSNCISFSLVGSWGFWLSICRWEDIVQTDVLAIHLSGFLFYEWEYFFVLWVTKALCSRTHKSICISLIGFSKHKEWLPWLQKICGGGGYERL